MTPGIYFRGLLYFVAMWWMVGCHTALVPEELRGPADFDFETIRAFTQMGEPGVLIALLGDPELQASRLQMSYRLKNQQAFQARLMACNQTPGDLEYYFFVLIDYRQQTFTLDGNAANAHSVSLPKGDCKTFALGVPPLSTGSHDMILAGIDPDFGLVSHRAVLLVGDEDRFPDHALLDVGGDDRLSSGEDVSLRCLPSQDSLDSIERSFPVYLAAANTYTETLKAALVLFSNKGQVRVTDSGDAQGMFLILAPKKGVRIKIAPSSIRPDERLWALMIENPYTVLEPHRGVMAQLPTAVMKSNALDRKDCMS